MKKILAIVIAAACLTACNSNADSSGTHDSTSVSADSSLKNPAGADAPNLRTDTTGPKPDSGMGK